MVPSEASRPPAPVVPGALADHPGRPAGIRRSPSSGTTRGAVGRSGDGGGRRKSTLNCSIAPTGPSFGQSRSARLHLRRSACSVRAVDLDTASRSAGTAVVRRGGPQSPGSPSRSGAGRRHPGHRPEPGRGRRRSVAPAIGAGPGDSAFIGRPHRAAVGAADDLVVEAVGPLHHRLVRGRALDSAARGPATRGRTGARASPPARSAPGPGRPASPGWTRRPVSPSATISAIPPTSQATTGFPNDHGVEEDQAEGLEARRGDEDVAPGVEPIAAPRRRPARGSGHGRRVAVPFPDASKRCRWVRPSAIGRVSSPDDGEADVRARGARGRDGLEQGVDPLAVLQSADEEHLDPARASSGLDRARPDPRCPWGTNPDLRPRSSASP